MTGAELDAWWAENVKDTTEADLAAGITGIGMTGRTPDERRVLDEVANYEGGTPEARAWVESHVELILSQARMMGELDSAADFDAASTPP